MAQITITKKQLVEKVSNKADQTKIKTKEIIQLFLDVIIKELQKGNRIELRDFGVFEVKTRASRMGRNPRTGEAVAVLARKVVSFKVGRKMKLNVAKAKKSDK
ncbi:MAG TPA: HU family DNA-binding protein [Planctomycetota bacterium]|nr:HU family DNA-binding protein [Planctomycetota bacterium]HQB01334.1 HU family DNA-binding protein [Planctomycetota bacterium]